MSGDIVAFIGDILTRRGAESYLGEAVTMQQHMLQSACFAEREGAAEDLVAAALLHDIGHYTNEFGDDYLARNIDNRHEDAGARVLAGHFPDRVVACVRLHVAAKRYLCATDRDYLACLSSASLQSLVLQGGAMDAAEAAAFAQVPFAAAAVQVRRWDDAGKIVGMATPNFAAYAPLLRRVMRAASAPAGPPAAAG